MSYYHPLSGETATVYIAPYMPVNELPEGYEYIGDLSEDAASDTGLAGCKMYAVKEKNSFEDFPYQHPVESFCTLLFQDSLYCIIFEAIPLC